MTTFSSSLFPSFALEPLYDLFGFLLRRHALLLRSDYNINCLYLMDKTCSDHRRKTSRLFETFLMRKESSISRFSEMRALDLNRLLFPKRNFIQEQQRTEGYPVLERKDLA